MTTVNQLKRKVEELENIYDELAEPDWLRNFKKDLRARGIDAEAFIEALREVWKENEPNIKGTDPF